MNKPYELPENQDPIKSKYVILEGLDSRNRFFSNNSPKDNELAINKDGKWYKAFTILGYANTIAEAQMFLFGKVSTKAID